MLLPRRNAIHGLSQRHARTGHDLVSDTNDTHTNDTAAPDMGQGCSPHAWMGHDQVSDTNDTAGPNRIRTAPEACAPGPDLVSDTTTNPEPGDRVR